jgi:hypothetical protein
MPQEKEERCTATASYEPLTMATTISFTAPRMEKDAAAKEFEQMSDEKKEEVYRDIYGTTLVVEETPELLKLSLEQLRQNWKHPPPMH